MLEIKTFGSNETDIIKESQFCFFDQIDQKCI